MFITLQLRIVKFICHFIALFREIITFPCHSSVSALDLAAGIIWYEFPALLCSWIIFGRGHGDVPGQTCCKSPPLHKQPVHSESSPTVSNQ